MYGDWYARHMYLEGSDQYLYHLRHYGRPSRFGYKDLVRLWKAEKFEPDNLMDLYRQAGARYFVAQAMHNDHFFNFTSKLKWNHAPQHPSAPGRLDRRRTRYIRFTSWGKTVYAFMMRTPGRENGAVVIRSFTPEERVVPVRLPGGGSPERAINRAAIAGRTITTLLQGVMYAGNDEGGLPPRRQYGCF
jgi:hypothetical protein